MRQPSAVLLDMDGTLVDTEPLWWRAVEQVAGRELGREHAAHIHGQAVPAAARWLATTSGRSSDQLEEALSDAFLTAVCDDLPVLEGAQEVLQILADHLVPAALVSASPRRVVDVVMAALGRDLFAHSVAEGETERTKPHPDPYLAAATALGVAISDCLVVEDSPPGIAAALAAGAQVVLAPGADVGATTLRRLTSLVELCEWASTEPSLSVPHEGSPCPAP